MMTTNTRPDEEQPEDNNGSKIHPMEIPLVVSQMMMNLDIKNLLNCRFISQQYNKMSLFILTKYKIQDFQLELKYSRESKQFYIPRHDHNTQKIINEPLHRLNELLKLNGFNFLCNEFRISDGSLASPDLQKFLSLHGQKIRKLQLKLNEDRDVNALELFRKLLLVQAYNIQELHIENMPFEIKSAGAGQLFSPGEINLRSKLKFLQSFKILSIDKIDMRFSCVIGDLIMMATNLTDLHNCPTQSMCQAEPRLMDKMKLVKSLNLHPEETNWSFCCDLADLTNNLTHVHFTLEELYHCPQSWSRVANTVSNIFRKSHSTLIHFGADHLSFLHGLELPQQFENVTTINLQFWKEYSQEIDDWRLLPLNGHRNLSELFPKVENLIFKTWFEDGDEDAGDAWGHYLSTVDDPLPTLRSLEFRDQILDGAWLDKFSILCPCITVLKIGTYSVPFFPFFCTEIAKYFTLIETFNIFTDDGYDGYHELPGDFTAKMDSAITGIPVDTCTEMASQGHDLQLMSQNDWNLPSICTLPYLKSFTIDFPPVRRPYQNKSVSLFSKISGVFGFQLMTRNLLQRQQQRLNVTIHATRSTEMEQMLVDIQPFVQNMVWQHA